jgi:hypothetical protein
VEVDTLAVGTPSLVQVAAVGAAFRAAATLAADPILMGAAVDRMAEITATAAIIVDGAITARDTTAAVDTTTAAVDIMAADIITAAQAFTSDSEPHTTILPMAITERQVIAIQPDTTINTATGSGTTDATRLLRLLIIHSALVSCLFPLVPCQAQQTAPVGIIRGDLLAWSGNVRQGELVFRRGSDNQVYQCSFDERTYFERQNERINISSTSRGDQVEVLSDRKQGTGICYARTVQVIDPNPTRTGYAARLRPHSTFRSSIDSIVPRGDLTYAGVVLKIAPGELVLRLRTNEKKIILLRPDTRYLSEGQLLERSNLLVNTRVFVRAGRTFEDDIEAYQIMWGDILQPVVQPTMW